MLSRQGDTLVGRTVGKRFVGGTLGCAGFRDRDRYGDTEEETCGFSIPTRIVIASHRSSPSDISEQSSVVATTWAGSPALLDAVRLSVLLLFCGIAEICKLLRTAFLILDADVIRAFRLWRMGIRWIHGDSAMSLCFA